MKLLSLMQLKIYFLQTKQIPKLKAGDTVALIASARKVRRQELSHASKIIKSWGLKVCCGKNLFNQHNQFSGTIKERAQDLQWAIDDKEVKAILFVRGGYGSVQIIDYIVWEGFQKNPKWLIGFSDVTVFHSHIHQNIGTPTLHAAMPITFPKNTESSLHNLRNILFGKQVSYKIENHYLNRRGICSGKIVGGNLSIIYSLLGSKSQMSTKDKILFIEDVDEYLYHIDRMMQALKRAGILRNIAGLIVGAMTEMNDNSIPFGKTAQEIILDAVSEYSYPVCFEFPAGHINNNNPFLLGEKATLEVCEKTILK